MLEIVAMNLLLMAMDARYFGTEDPSLLYIHKEFNLCEEDPNLGTFLYFFE